MTKYYVAYGADLDSEVMKTLCPTAQPIARAWVFGVDLDFAESKNPLLQATLRFAKHESAATPVIVYELDEAGQEALANAYEGHKRIAVGVDIDGKEIEGFVYVPTGKPLQRPCRACYQALIGGYKRLHDMTFRKGRAANEAI